MEYEFPIRMQVPANAPLPRVSIARDLAITAITSAMFAWDASLRKREQHSGLAAVVGITSGVLAALTGFLAHEWGHLTGSLATQSVVHYPNKVFAPLLFHFDTTQNDREQFLAMSYGGYVASAVGVAAIALCAPLEAVSGRVALGLAGVGMLVTLVAEVPTTLSVLRGDNLPEGYAFRPPTG